MAHTRQKDCANQGGFEFWVTTPCHRSERKLTDSSKALLQAIRPTPPWRCFAELGFAVNHSNNARRPGDFFAIHRFNTPSQVQAQEGLGARKEVDAVLRSGESVTFVGINT